MVLIPHFHRPQCSAHRSSTDFEEGRCESGPTLPPLTGRPSQSLRAGANHMLPLATASPSIIQQFTKLTAGARLSLHPPPASVHLHIHSEATTQLLPTLISILAPCIIIITIIAELFSLPAALLGDRSATGTAACILHLSDPITAHAHYRRQLKTRKGPSAHPPSACPASVAQDQLHNSISFTNTASIHDCPSLLACSTSVSDVSSISWMTVTFPHLHQPSPNLQHFASRA